MSQGILGAFIKIIRGENVPWRRVEAEEGPLVEARGLDRGSGSVTGAIVEWGGSPDDLEHGRWVPSLHLAMIGGDGQFGGLVGCQGRRGVVLPLVNRFFWSPGAPKGFFAPGRGRVQMKEASPKGLASSGADEARARLAAGKTRHQ